MSETPVETPAPQQEPAATEDPNAADQGNPGEEALGDAGKQAIDRMKAERNEARQAAKALEQQLSEAQSTQQAQLDAIAKALGFKSDEEAPDPAKITAELEESRRAAAENAAALVRYKTAVEKQVPSHLVEFITGSTAEEVEASIEKVMAAFNASKPAGPRPDPSQGVQGAPASLDAQIAEAQKRGDIREVIRLKSGRALANPTN